MENSNGKLILAAGGFGVTASVSIILLMTLGAGHLVTGISWGLGVALAGTALYVALLPRPGAARFLRKYLSGAVLRYAIMVAAFCGVVFVLKVNTAGVLIGTFVGMMTATFVSLSHMRQKTSPGAEA